ncbi:glycosyltransferase family 9 protein [Actinomadura sp. CNU-125]|uniref:glycosyltransferase family 9 protein n=1 Tax=Actinomadura sp. CNU-125 TaxID=1904961 RepID=UPI0021CCF859|nr:glycosyltransferase family 9 protein [Actinomadura sp. CNU-125]
MRSAQKKIGALLADLADEGSEDSLVRPEVLSVLMPVFGAAGADAPAAAARSLVSSIGAALRGSFPVPPEPICHVARLDPSSVRRLVVQVGPTIGLGDELLLARALAERAMATGVELEVASERPGLWTWYEGARPVDGTGCLAALHRVTELPGAERARTAYLHIDFDTTPGEAVYIGPPGLAFAGHWSMQCAGGRLLDPSDQVTYGLRYPDGLPESRWSESRWMAGRVLPGGAGDRAVDAPDGPWRAARMPRRGRVVLQVLTSKPSLMLPPRFYAEIVARLAATTDAVTEVRLLSAPDPAGRELVARTADAIRDGSPVQAVTVEADTDLAHTFASVRDAELFLGPDTFTTHVAAMAGVPQVSMALPEHSAWFSVAAPAVTVPFMGDQRPFAERVVQAASAMLSHARTEPLDRQAATWAERIARIDEAVRHYLHDEEPGALLPLAEETKLAHDLVTVLTRATPPDVAWLTDGLPVTPPPAAESAQYHRPTDLANALVRWYRDIATSNLSGLLLARKAAADAAS